MQKLLLFLAAAAVIASPALAHAVSEPSLKDALSQIAESQNVPNASQISCDSITQDQFADLGDAFMALRHPNADEHAFMDQMMGGDGSDSLRQAHIYMGQAYLGCGGWTGMGWGMMGPGMIGSSYQSAETDYRSPWYGDDSMMRMPFSTMMSGWGYGMGAFGWVTTLLIWTILILGIIWLIKNLSRKK